MPAPAATPASGRPRARPPTATPSCSSRPASWSTRASTPRCRTIRSRISRRSRWSRPRRTCWWSIRRCRRRRVTELVALIKANPGKYSLRAARRRLDAASVRRTVQAAQQSRSGARAVHRRRARDPVDARRPHADRLHRHAAGDRRGEGRQAARARRRPAPQRSPALPDCRPSRKPGFRIRRPTRCTGIVVPAGTPKEIVDLLHREIVDAMAQPDVKEKLAALGFEPSPTRRRSSPRASRRDSEMGQGDARRQHQSAIRNSNMQFLRAVALRRGIRSFWPESGPGPGRLPEQAGAAGRSVRAGRPGRPDRAARSAEDVGGFRQTVLRREPRRRRRQHRRRRRCARAPADGYSMHARPARPRSSIRRLYKSLPYDPYKDLVAVTRIATSPNVLVVHPSVPARPQGTGRTDQARPGQYHGYAHPGLGTPSHLSGDCSA